MTQHFNIFLFFLINFFIWRYFYDTFEHLLISLQTSDNVLFYWKQQNFVVDKRRNFFFHIFLVSEFKILINFQRKLSKWFV